MNVYEIARVRTNNFASDVMEKIVGLWSTVQNDVVNQDVYAIYHNYVSDYRGDYTLSICREKVQENTVQYTIGADTYKVFDVPADDARGVFHTWQQIWSEEDSGTLDRAYTFDYEHYNSDGSVKIYIAIK